MLRYLLERGVVFSPEGKDRRGNKYNKFFSEFVKKLCAFQAELVQRNYFGWCFSR